MRGHVATEEAGRDDKRRGGHARFVFGAEKRGSGMRVGKAADVRVENLGEPHLADGHAVLGQRARFVRADVCAGVQREQARPTGKTIVRQSARCRRSSQERITSAGENGSFVGRMCCSS